MATVTIDSTSYTTYASVATADTYMDAEVSAAATKWRNATLTDADAKARALVSATRVIDKQLFPGSKTDEDQSLAWPRTGTGLSGVETDVIPQQIVDASILLAAEINNGVDVGGSATTYDRIKDQKAGSVSISYFKDFDEGTRFPTTIQELLNGLLGSGSGLTGLGSSIAYGADTCSDFDDDYEPSVW